MAQGPNSFLVPDWGKKPAMASGRRTGPPSYEYKCWRVSTTTRRHKSASSCSQRLKIRLQCVRIYWVTTYFWTGNGWGNQFLELIGTKYEIVYATWHKMLTFKAGIDFSSPTDSCKIGIDASRNQFHTFWYVIFSPFLQMYEYWTWGPVVEFSQNTAQ